MFRRTQEDLMDMLPTYGDILNKEELTEIEKYRNNYSELKTTIRKVWTRVSLISRSTRNFEKRDRIETLTKILTALDCKLIKISSPPKMQTK